MVSIEGVTVKTAIVHFFEIEIKYDSKGKFHAENDGNICFFVKTAAKMRKHTC